LGLDLDAFQVHVPRMTGKPTLLNALRTERGPLAALAMLAVLVRATVLMVGLTASPVHALDGIGQLCEPSVTFQSGQPAPPHDFIDCSCVLTCVHSAWQGSPGLLSSMWVPLPHEIGSGAAFDQLAIILRARALARSGPIRAPPYV